MTRREFLEAIAVALASGIPLTSSANEGALTVERLYTLPQPPGKVSVMHFTDCHAQLLPVHFREPDTNIGIAGARGQPPHLVGEALLRHFGISPGTALAHAYTHLDYAEAALRYGKLGGFAHLATLINMVRTQRPGALLLDGGDSWQGSATALWSQGRDMIAASRQLGIDMMTGHWEFTYGAARVEQAIKQELNGSIEFIAQNVRTTDFDDPVFKSYVMREINGIPVAVIGQAFPYTPIANPRHFVPDWTFGIQEERLQKTIDEVRAQGAWTVLLLSHNGMDVDLKLASRVSGLDAILGGHTHDAVPRPQIVKNARGHTLVTNAGSNGKFLAVLDLDVGRSGMRDYHYALLPVFSNVLPADAAMSALIEEQRAPHAATLSEKLAQTEGLLYRRGNFNGTLDQVILDALMATTGCEIALSPGFRWGTSVLPHSAITVEDVMNATAITYPYVVMTEMTGGSIKSLLEDICDNLFNPDPYYQQGGDMVRIGGMQYRCNPTQTIGARISDMRFRGKRIDADRRYKVASWAPVAEGVAGEPIWELVIRYLRDKKIVGVTGINEPGLIGVAANPGVAR
jgi:sulfur-oxidizing protein SoxB